MKINDANLSTNNVIFKVIILKYKYYKHSCVDIENLQGISGNFEQVETQLKSEKEYCSRKKSVRP